MNEGDDVPEPGIKLVTYKSVYYVTIFFFRCIYALIKSMLKIHGEKEKERERVYIE